MPARRDWIYDILLIRPVSRTMRPMACWLALAVVSVALAAWIGRDGAGMMLDLHEVRSWLRVWMVDGHNPYTSFAPDADYPPMAFLLLAPLGLSHSDAVAWWFLPISISSLAIAGWLMLRWLTRELNIALTSQETIALVAMLLATGSARRAIWHGQTVALSIIFGMLALQWTSRRRVMSGLALALCAFKPHFGLGVALALVVTSGTSSLVTLSVAALATALSFVAFAWTLALPTSDVVASWVHNIASIYTGPDRVHELLGARFLFDGLTQSPAASLVIWMASAVAALVMIVRATHVSRAQRIIACLMWSLVFLPHQLYDGLLALPALWWMMWPEGGLGARPRWLAASLAAALLLSDVIDVSGAMREIARHIESQPLFTASQWLPPIRMIALLALVLPTSAVHQHYSRAEARKK